MIPLFKTHYSIGKSILTPEDVLSLSSNLPATFLVEDAMVGFRKTNELFKNAGRQLIFGLRFNCCDEIDEEPKKTKSHKLIAFAKNDAGCKILNLIYTEQETNGARAVTSKFLKDTITDDIKLVVPFYDSFIHKNKLTNDHFIFDFGDLKPTFFVEEHGLPWEQILVDAIHKFIGNKYPVEDSYSIYYKKDADYRALQTYKILTNRRFGTEQNLRKPELEHFCSCDFSFESYEKKSKI